jgi:D-amino-acid dehydrogenase
MKPKRVAVLGAGIIGCTTAYALATAGFEVSLIEAEAGAATLTSRANGAQLSYSYVEPLASPATLRGLPGMLLLPNSPLKVRPAFDFAQWCWGWNFLRACTQTQASSTTRHLFALGALSRNTLDAWLAKEAWPCEHARAGKLVLYSSAAGLARARVQVSLQAALGAQQTVLDRDECVAHESALAASKAQFVGGVFTASECVADPHKLCSAIVNSLEQNGSCFLPNFEVKQIRTTAHGVTLKSTDASLDFDAVVLCNGSRASPLDRELKLFGKIYPIKGYSVTLPITNAALAPQMSVTDLSRKTVFARLGSHLRVAGRAEIVGHDLRIEPKRIEELARAAHALFPGACANAEPMETLQPWAGLRPATASGLPIISRTRHKNVWVNLGHGALGLTMAAGAAACISAMLLDEPPPLDMTPYTL